MAAVALTSCSIENEVITPDEEITFKAVNYKNTKAEFYGPINGTAYPEAEHFGVFAFHSATSYNAATPYMSNVEVEKDATYWKHATDSYYWPKEGDLKFACYSPYEFGSGTVSADATDGVAFTDFTTTADLDKQVDLMTSKVSAGLTAGPVNVPFQHLLSQITFTVKTDKEYGPYDKVDSFKVNSITFTVKSQADYVPATGNWSYRDIDLTYNTLGAEYYITKNGSIQKLGTPVMIIPQDAVEITVNYTIDYDGDNVVTTDAKYTPTEKWNKNTIYTYNITIGLDEILFSPVVEPWDTTIVSEDFNIIG